MGQLPVSLALTRTVYSLWVANAGGESIMEIDTKSLKIVRNVRVSAAAVQRPDGHDCDSVGGWRRPSGVLLAVMSDGSLWDVKGDDAIRAPSRR